MSLEIPYILGSEPRTSATILYSFYQQNELFDAFSKKTEIANIEFLWELSNVFAMIGLLILLFSPHLWRAKYLVSWFFLFLVVVLGASTGPELGYKVMDTSSAAEYLNMPIDSGRALCSNAENQGQSYCNKVGFGTAAADEGIRDAGGAGVATAASVAASGVPEDSSKLQVDDKNRLTKMSISGFAPQVYILYITNKLKDNLSATFSNLAQATISKKAEVLNLMRSARLPNSQLNVWVLAFNDLCGADVAEKTGLTAPQLLSLDAVTAQELIDTPLSTKEFMIKDVLSVMKKSFALHDKHNDMSPVMLDIPNYKTAITKETKLGAYFEYFTVQGHDYVMDTYTEGKEGLASKRLMKIKNLRKGNFDKPNEESTAKLFKQYMMEFGNDYGEKSSKIILAANKLSKSESDALIAAEPEVNNKIKTQLSIEEGDCPMCGGFMYEERRALIISEMALPYVNSYKSISNCNDFLKEYRALALQMSKQEVKDVVEQVLKHFKVSLEDMPEMNKVLDTTVFPKSLSTKLKFYDVLSIINASSKNSDGQIDERERRDFIAFLNKSAIENSLMSSMGIVQKSQDVSLYLKDQGLAVGAAGIAKKVGSAITDVSANFVLFLETMKVKMKAGAYSIILPIIKDMLLGLMILITPILFLLGLLIPSWAPGVIVTSLISVAFLQMVDVTVILVNTVVFLMKQIMAGVANKESYDATIQFLDLVSALAYMSSFAITAFIMFAAGDTKALMGKLAGADATIKSTSQDIMNTGVKAGMIVAGAAATGGAFAASAATGGAIGGKAGAEMLAKGKAFAAVAKEDGFKGAVAAQLGSSEARQAQLDQAAYSTLRSGQRDEAKALATKNSSVNYEGTEVSMGHAEHLKASYDDAINHGIDVGEMAMIGSRNDDEKRNHAIQERVSKMSDISKQQMKANLLSGATFSKDITYRDASGRNQTAFSFGSKVPGLTKDAELMGLGHETGEIAMAEVIRAVAKDKGVQKISKGSSFQKYDKDKGMWGMIEKSKGTMEMHSMSSKDYNEMISNIAQKARISDAQAKRLMGTFVNHKYQHKGSDGKISVRYAVDKIGNAAAEALDKKAGGNKPKQRK